MNAGSGPSRFYSSPFVCQREKKKEIRTFFHVDRCKLFPLVLFSLLTQWSAKREKRKKIELRPQTHSRELSLHQSSQEDQRGWQKGNYSQQQQRLRDKQKRSPADYGRRATHSTPSMASGQQKFCFFAFDSTSRMFVHYPKSLSSWWQFRWLFFFFFPQSTITTAISERKKGMAGFLDRLPKRSIDEQRRLSLTTQEALFSCENVQRNPDEIRSVTFNVKVLCLFEIFSLFFE